MIFHIHKVQVKTMHGVNCKKITIKASKMPEGRQYSITISAVGARYVNAVYRNVYTMYMCLGFA